MLAVIVMIVDRR